MQYLIIGVIILLIVEAVILKKKYLKQTERDFSEYQVERSKAEAELRNFKQNLDEQYNEAYKHQEQQLRMLKTQESQERTHLEEQKTLLIKQLDEQKRTYDGSLSDYKVNREKLINEQISNYEKEARHKIELKLQEQQLSTQRACEDLQKEIDIFGNEVKTNLGKEINALIAELQDYQKKRTEINEAIMREREIEEKQDFYRIQIDQNSLDDIAALRSILPTLHNADAFNKLIYDLYIARPVKEMEKRVLNDEVFSGIYKITGLDGQIYIGKSTDIKSRWQQHSKSCFHCGTISRSTLHAEMEKKGIQNFTFEVLERVPKENLSEREKFWISFYGSDKYGMNMRAGG